MFEHTINLTVFFEDPFWVGIFERQFDENYEVSRVVFGSEPKDEEVYQFILSNFYKLKFASTKVNEICKDKKINPKRMHRKIKKEVQSKGIGTKAQNALKLQYEENKITRKKSSKQKKEEEAERKFELKQIKKKEKHRGH